MKRVLLNESQIKLLSEEINKNDTIQKLIFTSPSDITFNIEKDLDTFILIPVINGKGISGDFVTFKAKEVNLGGNILYQLYIRINEDIQRLSIAEKLYTSFIMQGYPVCSLFKYHNNDAIRGLWQKIEKNPFIHTEKIKCDGEPYAIIAYREDEENIDDSSLICENRFTKTIFYGCHNFKDYANRLLHIAKTTTIIALSVYIQTIKNIPVGTLDEKERLLQQIEEVIDDSNNGQQINTPKSFTMSDDGIEHLKKYETFSATPYYATRSERKVGKKTIGYGHVITNSDPAWIRNAKSITEEQATQLLISDVKIHTIELQKAVSKLPKHLQKPELYTQGFIDAAISMVYNSGYGNFISSPFYQTWKKCRIDKSKGGINTSDYNFTVSMIKDSCITQNGKKVNGLVNRRKTEAQMARL